MLKAVDPQAVTYFTPKAFVEDLSGGQAPCFHVRTLTAREYSEIQDSSVTFDADGTTKPLIGTQNYLALRFALVGWGNVVTETGAPIPFEFETQGKRRVASNAALDLIPAPIRAEIATFILNGCKLSETDRGN